MRVAVLGAGVIGVASAWYLARAGHEVTVVERQPGPALETSCANGGQISVSHAEPWANPGAPWKIVGWLGREDAPLLFRPRLDARQWLWGARFLFECLPHRSRANAQDVLALALASLGALKALREETGIRYDEAARGILSFYTGAREFEQAARLAEALRPYGCIREVRAPWECVAIEPALRWAAPRLAGGIFAPGDESGDARLFTERLAALCESRGVRFLFSRAVERLVEEEGEIAGALLAAAQGGETQRLAADAYVVALGSYSAPMLRSAGISVPVYPVKGYSVTLPVGSGHEAPRVSLTDEAAKLVFSRLGERLRVAGTAEFAGYDCAVTPSRCDAILARTFDLFPAPGERSRAEFWTGLRPAMPGNVPLIGRTRYPNLFLNTGHGTLGFTLACGSGKALAEIVSGRAPQIDFPFL